MRAPKLASATCTKRHGWVLPRLAFAVADAVWTAVDGSCPGDHDFCLPSNGCSRELVVCDRARTARDERGAAMDLRAARGLGWFSDDIRFNALADVSPGSCSMACCIATMLPVLLLLRRRPRAST